jgi:Peroxidase
VLVQVMLKEKRLGSFCLRASFHDCGTLPPAANGNAKFDGCNGGLCFLLDELSRDANTHDLFAAHSAKIVSFAAETFRSSYADALSVCAMVGVKMVQGPEFYSIPVGLCT